MRKGNLSYPNPTLINLCYSETNLNDACLCVIPNSIVGNTNISQYIVASSFIPSLWERFAVPINTITKNNLPGTQIPTTYYSAGASSPNLKNCKLYIPSQNFQNIQVKVISSGLRTTTSSPYSYAFASLYWCVANIDDQLPGQKFIGFSDGIPIYGLDPDKSFQFPNSPTIDSRNGGNTALLNTEYTATIPQINNGEALYVFWYCIGNNYSNFDYAGFSTLNMRISISQL